jgi:hypothetical protein
VESVVIFVKRTRNDIQENFTLSQSDDLFSKEKSGSELEIHAWDEQNIHSHFYHCRYCHDY